MKLANISLALLLGGLGVSTVGAQNSDKAAQDQAMRVLRQTLANESKEKAPAAEKAQAAEKGKSTEPPSGDKEKGAPMATTSASSEAAMAAPAMGKADAEAQRQAMEALDKALAEGRPEMKPAAKGTGTGKSAKSTLKASSKGKGNAAPAMENPSTMSTNAPAAATASAGGPKTKEERLKDLLRQYKDDKLTPEQYHEERAKIMSEP